MTKFYAFTLSFFLFSGIIAQDFTITDPTFGINGRAIIDQGVAASGSDNEGRRTMHVRSDDKILVIGTGKESGTDYDLFVGKFLSNGIVDTNFGNGGSVFIDCGGTADVAMGSDIGPNGEIFITGTYIDPFGTGFKNILVVSLNADGTVNTNFSDDGILTLNISATSTSEGRDIKVLPNGKILVAFRTSSANSNPGIDFAVMKLNANGTFDDTFGVNGAVVIPDPVTPEEVYKLAIQDDGKIVLGGLKNSSPQSYQFVKLTETGELDPDFGTEGIATLTHNDGNIPNLFNLSIEPDGKIIAGGNITMGVGSSLASVVRLNPDGTPDETFGTLGRVSLGLPTTARAVLKDNFDNYYIIGTDFGSVVSTKISGVGALMNLFGVSGTANFGNTIPNGVDVCGAMQPDGKYLIAGRVSQTGFQRYGVLRAGGPGIGISNLDSSSLTIYPNPAQNFITFEKDGLDKSTYTISDLQGRLVGDGTAYETTTISTELLKEGMYLLRVNGEIVKIIIDK